VSTQLDLDWYRADLAASARGEGERRAKDALSEYDWNAVAHEAIRELADSREPFTADAVRGRVGPGPSAGSLGAALAFEAREGLIACEGFATSRRPARHGGVLRVWRGVP
jgi:hypothetical protein